jgi:hypothetical protein
MIRNILLIVGLLLLATPVLADEDQVPADSQESMGNADSTDVGADASRADKRLPPVFPGEEIHDGKNRMKVWSTTGNVPVSQPPEPWNNNQADRIGGQGLGGVIVDDRSGLHRNR